jgi:hypothetical protein
MTHSRSLLLALGLATTLSGCMDTQLQPETARSMSSQGLCEMVNPSNFLVGEADRATAQRELQRRGARCAQLRDGTIVAR